jgi:type IV pilus assembly protein PilB
MGVITTAQLDEALQQQGADGRRLGEILIAKGYITRDHLALALARRLGVQRAIIARQDPAVADAIEPHLQKRYAAVPIAIDAEGRLIVAMRDPANVLVLDDLRMLARREVVPALALPEEIDDHLARVARVEEMVDGLAEQASVEADEADALSEITSSAEDAPVVRLVNSLISRAVEEGASDIHFEPQAREMVVRFRVDGVLRTVAKVPLSMSRGVASRVKVMAEMDIAERRIPQDGRVGLSVSGRSFDLRVVSLPTVFGEGAVIRLLDRSSVVMQLTDLGFTASTLARYEGCWRRPWGAVLVTGPTGSGKSTTVYGTLHQLNSGDRKIITVEDPVEYRLPGIQQMQVNNKAGLTFANGLRSVLRADPDVVMIGEIRDRETAQIAIEAALTGHLVLATVHTNDAATTLARLSKMGIEAFLSASAISGLLAQRLCRRLCTTCREREEVPLSRLREVAGDNALPAGLPERVAVYKSVGCPRCAGTGYKGRFGVYEMLVMTETLGALVVADAPADEIRAQARREGMRTMGEDALVKVLQGHTSIAEMLRTVA